jgi:acetylglutamate kinase
MEQIKVIKVGGKILEEEQSLLQLLDNFAAIEGKKVLVHGGGRLATTIGEKLGIESKYVDGRRITDAETLQVVTMVYGGLANKPVVAKLQARDCNALGLTGADMNIILAEKRPVKTIDYGYVGDVKKVDGKRLSSLIDLDIVPVMAPLTHDKKGNILNTNADTIAAETAKGLSAFYDVSLVYCFEKAGVLMDEHNDESVIANITPESYKKLKADNTIHSGMIPKLDNAFDALKQGVKEVIITNVESINSGKGTVITK